MFGQIPWLALLRFKLLKEKAPSTGLQIRKHFWDNSQELFKVQGCTFSGIGFKYWSVALVNECQQSGPKRLEVAASSLEAQNIQNARNTKLKVQFDLHLAFRFSIATGSCGTHHVNGDSNNE